MSKDWNPHEPSDPADQKLISGLTTYLTPTIKEVADWHFTDAALDRDWDRPLGKLLRSFVEDGSSTDLAVAANTGNDEATSDKATESTVAA